MDLNKKFGSVLKDTRKCHGLTQARLSDLTGISQSPLSRIERGDWNVSLEIIERIALAMGVHVEIFFSEIPRHNADKTPDKIPHSTASKNHINQVL